MRPTVLSLLFGWLTLISLFAIWAFLPIHGAGFAPEIGPLGAFILFGAILSGVFLVGHIFFATFYLSSKRRNDFAWAVGLAEAFFLPITIPMWMLCFGVHNFLYNSVYFAPFVFFAGYVSGFYVNRLTNKRGPNQALQHNDPSCHESCLRTPRASRGRG